MRGSDGSASTRRRYPRLEVLGRIEGQVLALDAHLTLRELSRGGFSVDCNRPFAPGAPHTFRFTTAEGLAVQLGAMSVHCRIGAIGHDGRQTFVAGFEWLEEPGSQEAIAGLVEVLTPILAQ